jgi:aspartyl-tRNA(Asn)/glutamyl-tRNA(Gln) amidotransferase subunit C
MDNLNRNSSPVIDINTVRYIANLIKLRINDEDAKVFSQQFSQIIEYFQILSDIDTSEVRPANENWLLNNIFRDDVIQESISREEFLVNAPDHEGSFIKVPRIFDDR